MSVLAKRFFIASLIYFIIGLLAQTVAGFDVWLGFNPLAYTAVDAATHIFLVGWLTQLALAFIYERWLGPVENLQTTAGMAILVLLNVGIPLTVLGRPGLAAWGGDWLGAAAALGAFLQLAAGVIFLREVRILFQTEHDK